MRAAMAKIEVTPDRNLDLAGFRMREQPMTGVLDPLFVRVLAVEDDEGRRAAIAVADSLAAPEAVVETIRAQAQSRFGLEPDCVHLACTHTHSAPCLVALRDGGDPDPSYVESFIARAVEGIAAALDALRPARFAVSRAEVELACDRRKPFVRRPRPPELDLEALTLWLYEDDPSRPFAALVNYACHAVIMRDRRASADWPGAACAALDAISGAGFTAVVMPGAGANLNPPKWGDPLLLDTMGQALAQAVAAAPRRPVPEDGPITPRTARYRLRWRMPDAAELEKDVRELQQAGPSTPPWRMTCLRWARDRLEELRAGRLPVHSDVTLHALAVGAVRFAFLPFETFTETGRAIKAAAPGRVFVAACANGIFGYLPIRTACDEGGYEVDEAHRFYDGLAPAPGSAEEITAAFRALL